MNQPDPIRDSHLHPAAFNSIERFPDKLVDQLDLRGPFVSFVFERSVDSHFRLKANTTGLGFGPPESVRSVIRQGEIIVKRA